MSLCTKDPIRRLYTNIEIWFICKFTQKEQKRNCASITKNTQDQGIFARKNKAS